LNWRLISRAGIASLLVLALAPCALAGVGKFKPAGNEKKPDLRDYQTIVITDFTDAVEGKMPDAAEEAQYRSDVQAAGKLFADILAEKVRRSEGFTAVTRAPTVPAAPEDLLVAGNLLVTGKLTRFKASNLAGRYIGFGAGSKLGALIEFRDAADSRLLGTVEVSLGSENIPGAINAIQTVERFMDGGAIRVSDELLIAKKLKHREETGRQGRLREKYTD